MSEDRELQEVLAQLSQLAPGPQDTPKPAGQALAALKQRVEVPPSPSWQEVWRNFWLNPNRRLATAVLMLLVVFGMAFSFPAVRAAASDFLGLFRVQKFAAVSISADQLALLENIAREGLMPGEVIIANEPGAITPADSLAEAARLTGLSTVHSLGLLGDPDEIYVADGGNGRFIIDVAGSRQILQMAGADPTLLADELDGKAVEVVIYPGVQQTWVDGTTLLQTPVPLVEYPGDLDPVPLGEAMLQAVGMNADEAARLARSIDWTSTLLLPIPQDIATFNEVTVNGSSGLVLSSTGGQFNALIWQQADVLYVLSGSGSANELLRLANSLR